MGGSKIEYIIVDAARKIGNCGCWSGVCCKITGICDCPNVIWGLGCGAENWAICYWFIIRY